MARPARIIGLAIVSADGMIANAAGVQPDSLKLEADQHFFHATLDAAAALVHGRNSAEGGPNMAQHYRLILTHTVPALAPDSQHARAVNWNPAGASLDEAWNALGLPAGGTLAVIGGTEPFGLFLRIGYDEFHLSRTGLAHLPGGRPVFPGIPPHSPEELLRRHGLTPGPARMLDPASELSLTTWRR